MKGISTNSSCPRAKHPLLQSPLSDSTKWGKTMAMPAIAFPFFKMYPSAFKLLYWSLTDLSLFFCFQDTICNMIIQTRMARRWTDPNPLVFFPLSGALWYFVDHLCQDQYYLRLLRSGYNLCLGVNFCIEQLFLLILLKWINGNKHIQQKNNKKNKAPSI